MSLLLRRGLISSNAVDGRGPLAGFTSDLLLHCNGVDASTTFVDSGQNTLTMTANNGAQLDTAQKQFGSASGLFPNSNSYLTAPDNAAWSFGSGNWTIDFWVRFNAFDARSIFITQGYDSTVLNRSWLIAFNDTANELELGQSTNGVNNFFAGVSWSPSTGTWYHVCMSRVSSTLTGFIDGTSVGTYTPQTLHASTGLVSIGRDVDGTEDLDGWMDEIRIINGAGITANFDKPTEPYTQ